MLIYSMVFGYFYFRKSSMRTSCSRISTSRALRISFILLTFSYAKASLIIFSRRAFTLRVDFGRPSKISFGS